MFETDKRKAIFLLHKEGMGARQIARRLGVSRNTVRAIIAAQGATPQKRRADKQRIDEELLRQLYQECAGRAQRVHEKLTEEQNIQVTYPTLTRMLRELGISHPPKMRCDRVPDEPGAEMQHDTSPYQVMLGERRTTVIASLLYLRYSKRRYLRFYRTFNRFRMKCFFHEALMFWGYSARQCIIDNTNLARLRGTGKNALIVAEMESFARQYGFLFCCHEVGHANRKAGEERSFWTVETNFFSGRKFESLEDLNAQAYQWATVRLEHRPQGKAGLIPAKAFELECGYLTKLPPHLPAPYQVHERGTDEYGYAAFDGNFYWVPGTTRGGVKVLQYSDKIAIYRARECLVEYPLPPDGVKNKAFSPQGAREQCHLPRRRKASTDGEEQDLRAIGEAVNRYLDFALVSKGVSRHEFLRKLVRLSRKMTAALFSQSIERALKYRITSIDTIARIAVLQLGETYQEELPQVEIDDDFREREAYQQGFLTDQPDFTIYDETCTTAEGDDDEEGPQERNS